MDFSIFTQPISTNKIEEYTAVLNSIGNMVDFYQGESWEKKYELALIGIKDSRGGKVESVKESPDYVRTEFYKLYLDQDIKLIDLGNIEQGESQQDTLFAVSEVTKELVKRDIIPIFIGGTQDFTLGIYKAFEKLEQIVNLTTVDRKIDFLPVNQTTSDSYLKDIILSQPNFLFNYSNLGSQAYFLNPENEKMLRKLYFDNLRLGELQSNLTKAEPILRNTNIFSFDICSIRQSEAPGTSQGSPNGLFGNEACQIARYAGISDKMNVAGFFEMTPEFDNQSQTSQLVAQMIWCFLDGFKSRKHETPLTGDKNYTKYKVVLTNTEEELIFIKSNKSQRWWMKIPYPPSQKIKYERHHLVPCSYEDYLTALSDEMPDLWLNTYSKISI